MAEHARCLVDKVDACNERGGERLASVEFAGRFLGRIDNDESRAKNLSRRVGVV